MQVRTGDAARLAAQGDTVAAADLLPHVGVHVGQVRIPRHVAKAMVHLDVVAIAVEIAFHQDHRAVPRRIDGIARVAGEVHARVHLARARDRVAAITEGAGEVEGARRRTHRRDRRNVRGLVARHPGQGEDVVIGLGLHVGPLFQAVQPQGRPAQDVAAVQHRQRGIAVVPADSRVPHGRRNFVLAVHRPVDAVVPHFQQGHHLLVVVQAGAHLLQAGLPVGILSPQDRRLGQVYAQHPNAQPHVQHEQQGPGRQDDERLQQPVPLLPLQFDDERLGVQDIFALFLCQRNL